MKHHQPTRPAPATPLHEFLVLCARPESPLAPETAPAEPATARRQRLLADVDSMFWHPAQFGNDAA
jgi:hypothetical protein